MNRAWVSPHAATLLKRSARVVKGGQSQHLLSLRKRLRVLSTSVFLFCSCFLSSAGAMTELADDELSSVSGQALMQMGKEFIAGGSRVIDGQNYSYNGLTFYKAGLDVEIETNLNIEKLQLGCGGINGPGCDIDIDQLSLSGNCTVDRPSCAATLVRPFFEFAIKNDQSRTLREVVGIRMSAEGTQGMLTTGQNGPTPNGINVLSGYLRTQQIFGQAQTEASVLGGPADPCRADPASCGVGSYTGNLDIRANLNVLLTANILARTDGSRGTGIALPSLSVPFQSGPGGALVFGNRVTSTSVQVTGNVPQINFPASTRNNPTTTLIANVVSCSGSACGLVPGGDIFTYANQGGLSGLGLVSNFTQNLGYIHRLNVNSPFSLSFQRENVWWPDSNLENIALPGWWMAFEDPVDLGFLSPVDQVDISPTFPQVIGLVNNYFNSNPLQLGLAQGWTALTGNPPYMNVDMPVINLAGQTVSIDLTDLPLSAAQDVPRNCWGTASFC